MTRDLAKILPMFEEELTALARRRSVHTVAYHPPCTLQHGQQIRGRVEQLLTALGLEVCFPDSHLCCGSAGTYSVLQPKLSYTLAQPEARPAGEDGAAGDCIGECRVYRAFAERYVGTSTPVTRWIQLLEHLIYG